MPTIPKYLTRRALLSASALVLLAGCSSFGKLKSMFKEMLALQEGVAKEFNEPNTNINISNSTLVVTFVNSKIATLPEQERAATARRVAEYVRDNYPGFSSVTRVAVGFQTRASVGVASATKTEAPYSFTRTELGAPAHAETAPREDTH